MTRLDGSLYPVLFVSMSNSHHPARRSLRVARGKKGKGGTVRVLVVEVDLLAQVAAALVVWARQQAVEVFCSEAVLLLVDGSTSPDVA